LPGNSTPPPTHHFPAIDVSATLSAPPRSVSPEHRGRAREFRTRLAVEDPAAQDLVDAIGMPLRARLRRGSIPRADALADAARRWRDDMPTAGRIALEIDVRGRAHLTIKELRASAARVHLDVWQPGASEPGVAILLTGFAIHRRAWKPHHELLAGLTLHSLGRFFQRSFDTSHASLIAAMQGLAAALGSAPLASGAEFEASVSCGRWRGNIQLVHDLGRSHFRWCRGLSRYFSHTRKGRAPGKEHAAWREIVIAVIKHYIAATHPRHRFEHRSPAFGCFTDHIGLVRHSLRTFDRYQPVGRLQDFLAPSPMQRKPIQCQGWDWSGQPQGEEGEYWYPDTRCGREIAHGEPVTRIRQTNIYDGFGRMVATVCQHCVPRIRYEKQGRPLGEYRSAPCLLCSRTVSYLFRRRYPNDAFPPKVYCCEQCRAAHRARLNRAKQPKAEPNPVKCAGCSAKFLPKRSIMKYCTSACRHRAFRQRQPP
jgi:hypothetical protein